MAVALARYCNAAAEHPGSALRVSLSASMDFVTPLGKGGLPYPCEACLAMNADKPTELAIIIWIEHYRSTSCLRLLYQFMNMEIARLMSR
jgi:hypothetical protein